jgi:Homeodomain-like domain
MEAEAEQFVIADLLANAIEPWDALTARELEALGARTDPDSPLAVPIIIAAYRNELGPVLIDGIQRLQWLASPPRSRTTISADEVIVDASAIDEASAHLAAVKLHVNRRPVSARVKAELAVRLQTRFGWSQATIAEALKVSRPAVSNWIRQMGGSDVPEVTGADGKIYPARGKQAAEQGKIAVGGSVFDALKVLRAEHEAAVRGHPSIRYVKIDRCGTADPKDWKVTVPAQSVGAAAEVADRLRDQANDLLSLARKLSQAPGT